LTDFESYLTEQFTDGEPQEEPQVVEAAADPIEEEVAPETPDTSVAETPEPVAEPELILGKYKNVEDALKALEHSQSEIGRLRLEVGELRNQQPAPPPAPVNVDAVEDAFTTNPAAARQQAQSLAVQALQQNDHGAYERILEQWSQYDGFGALRFESARQAQVAQQQALAQIAPQVQTAQQYADQSASEAATRAVTARHADFEQVVGDLADEARVQQLVNQGFPMEYLAAARGTQAQKEQLLETLYRWKKAEQIEVAAAAAPVVAEQAAAEAKAAKVAAATASASSTPAIEETPEDQELQAFYDFLKAPSPTSWADTRPAGQ
jgi:hypothetical protein